jgi:trk system potassium uptake protein TrkH
MTMVSFLFLIFKKGIPLNLRIATRSSFSFLRGLPLKELLIRIIYYTLSIELIGFVVILIFLKEKGTEKIFNALFHSISAFCNAGFSSYSENISIYSTNYLLLLTIAFLFIIGGIGFFVLDDIVRSIKEKKRLSYYSRVVIKTNIFLILFFFLLFILLEWHNSLKEHNLIGKIVNAFFHIVTPRTAGFNSLNIISFSMVTNFMIILLMIIGGSPGGTAGGLKTTNFAVWASFLRSILKGEEEVNLLKRRIEKDILLQTGLIITLYFFVLGTGLFFVLTIEGVKTGFLEILFELVSALSTVGLSYGSSLYNNTSLSADFSIFSKVIVIIFMLIGRTGPITFWNAFIMRRKTLKRYPKAEILLF